MPLDDGRTYVIEVNGSPGWEGLQGVTSVDVAGEIAEAMLARARSGPSAAAGGRVA
jgi:glutathione synthase/RimK-type ligase-like ATP-grasp enzyme